MFTLRKVNETCLLKLFGFNFSYRVKNCWKNKIFFVRSLCQTTSWYLTIAVYKVISVEAFSHALNSLIFLPDNARFRLFLDWPVREREIQSNVEIVR